MIETGTAAVQPVEGGVAAPKGIRASGVAVGVKPGSTKKDCALIVSGTPCTLAGRFTTNVLKSPPVRWCQECCRRGHAQAVFINSGNANACTGERGAADVRTMAEAVAAGLGIAPEDACVCSTGVIGVPLPMDRILGGVKACVQGLSTAGGLAAAQAIMTTDTVPKQMSIEVMLGSEPVRIGVIAKGAGMIMPNLATMICAITTDAAIEAPVLDALLGRAVEKSFNRICVDNDMSTSDTVLCLANGRSGVSLTPNTGELKVFAKAFDAVCQEMAKKLVRDGEGATKFVEIAVSGASTDDDAKKIARAVAASQLCKTAFFGQDPNWGRIACAAGYAGVSFDPNRLSIWLDDLQLVRAGAVAGYAEKDAAALMHKPEFRIRIEVGSGPGWALYWTSDLSHDYVSINADYRS